MPSSASQQLKIKMANPKTNLGSGIVSVRVMAELVLPNAKGEARAGSASLETERNDP
jgi:hypothetical protein